MKEFVQFEMLDGSFWKLPIYVVENHRASSCYTDDFDSLEESLEDTRELFSIDSNEIIEWIECEMNWDDIKDHLVFVEKKQIEIDKMWYESTKSVI